jgi:hypothetical protein
LGILLAANGTWPVSFFIAALSFGVYLPVRLLSPRIQRRRGTSNLELAQLTTNDRRPTTAKT